MTTLPGTYIKKVESGNSKIDTLINMLVFPTIAEFQQLMIYYETGTVIGDHLIRFTYQNWNEAYPVELHLNGSAKALSQEMFSVQYISAVLPFQDAY